MQVNGNRLGSFANERSVLQGLSLSPFPYVLALEHLLRRLRDKEASPALSGILFAGSLSAKVSAYADDISLCVLPSKHKGCEEGGCKIQADSGDQDQL